MSMFPNLHDESLYIQGARDVLLRLKDDYAMYLCHIYLTLHKKEE